MSGCEGDRDKLTAGLSPTETDEREIIWLCATVNVRGSGQITVEQN